MEASIITTALTKKYPKTDSPALDKLNISVKSGEVYGFLGSNGAGKSTTIRTLLNFLQPTSGSATICGLDSVKDSVKAKHHVGYLSGEIALYPKVTTKEFAAYMSKLQRPKHSAYTTELAKRLDLDMNKPIETLSKGNRQKVGLLQALMHEPDVLILDEPTSGLDPLMQEEFFKLVAEAKQRGAAVFLSSHNLAEAQRICDRVGIIKHGKLIREQVLAGGNDLGKPVFRIVFYEAASIDRLKASKVLKLISRNGNEAVLQSADSIRASLAELGRYDIVSLTSEKLDLEDEFLEFYGDTTSD